MSMAEIARSCRVAPILVCALALISACKPTISIGPAATASPARAATTPRPTITTMPSEVVTEAASAPTEAAAAQTPAPTTAAATAQCTVTARGLNVRSGPGTNFGIVGNLAANQAITASGRNNTSDWLALKTPDGKDGWASAKFLNCTPGANTLPVATAQPGR